MRNLSGGAIEGVWLVGLLVLVPFGRRLAWGILLAQVIGWVVSMSLYILGDSQLTGVRGDTGFWHINVGWTFIISAAVLGGMFYCFGTGRMILGRVASWILVTPMLMSGLFHAPYSWGIFPAAGYFLGVFQAILDLYASHPSILLVDEMSIYERWPMWQPMLYPVVQWLDAILYVLWVALLFAAMYYFLKWVQGRNVDDSDQSAPAT